MATTGVFKISGRDYSPYLKAKTGLKWTRENTNDKDAGRDEAQIMHPNVTSHQRKLEVKLGNIPFEEAMKLEADLEAGDNGVAVTYPDLKDGICTRIFYNTSIETSVIRFVPDGVVLDEVSFTLISVLEATI